MKLLYVGVHKQQENPPPDKAYAYELVCEKYTASFSRFTRGFYDEALTTTAKIFAQSSEPGNTKTYVKTMSGMSYKVVVVGREAGVCGVAIVDEDYPKLPAELLLKKVLAEFIVKYPVSTLRDKTKDGHFPFPELKEYIVTYQNPDEAEPIAKIQKDLDITTNIMRENIIKAAERGDELDALTLKSANLATQAEKMFETARKQNSCCATM